MCVCVCACACACVCACVSVGKKRKRARKKREHRWEKWWVRGRLWLDEGEPQAPKFLGSPNRALHYRARRRGSCGVSQSIFVHGCESKVGKVSILIMSCVKE